MAIATPTSRGVTVAEPATETEWLSGARLLLDYFDWLAPLAGVESVPSVQPSAATELADLAATYAPPRHRFLLARQGSLAVGIVGIRPTGDRDTAELVRFYSRPAARGAGVGTALLTAALDQAAAFGFARVVLDTVPAMMPEAVRLYLRHGFVPSPDDHQLPVPDGQRFELDLQLWSR